ncbi:MAG: YciI family protein [Rhodanobacteraceae bacterium]
MWYAILGLDNENSLGARQSARSAHVARLKQLLDEGRLLLAGPFPAIDAEDPGPAGFGGSLIVAEFFDLATAQAWANDDPYIAAGVYREVSVRPFRKTLP